MNGSRKNKRCASWCEREDLSNSACSTVNWGSALMEELMETNVIANRNMVMLKELNGPEVNPALLSDLRHDKDIRSTSDSTRKYQSKADVMMEAKRILRKEEKAKKLFNMQDKIVSNEVDKFQNHITSLRKMNKRLERIAFPAVRKRPARSQNVYHMAKSACKPDCNETFSPFGKVKCDQMYEYQSGSGTEKSDKHQDLERWNSEFSTPVLNGKISLSISGSKMEEHEILQHNPLMSSQALSEYQNSVFERIHHRYMESERNRILREGTAFIRHSSPVNDIGKEIKIVEETKILSISNDPRCAQLEDWTEESTNDSNSIQEVAHKTEVFMNEWSLPSTICKEDNINPVKSSPNEVVKLNLDGSPGKEKEDGKHKSLKSFPPPIAIKKSDQNKLESMSKMYAKWMTKVCVSSSTEKCEELCLYKNNNMENVKDKCSVKQIQLNSVSREEKIMQVLNALQKHKDGKSSSFIDRSKIDNSRFSKSVNDIREEKVDPDNQRSRRAISGTYEHRLKAHKELITHQKVKLEEQKKQIEDLKLNQLRIEHEKSQMVTQRALNEVLETCNGKIKAQAKSLKSSLSLADLSPGNEFLLRMEQRALEQKQKKILSQERRKQVEEERKRKMTELEDKKRLEEEDRVKKKHDEAQELRRKERERREEARREREKLIALERKADHFCERRRLKNVIFEFAKLVSLRKKQEEIAMEFYEKYLMQYAVKVWKGKVDLKLKFKMDCADNFYASNLLRRSLQAFKMGVQEKMKYMQVAVDVHDFHLQEKYFHSWLNFVHVQQEIEANKIHIADLHFSKTLMLKCVRHWGKYPQVAQLEREKERRKMMWRNKVQQLLPDFRPILSTD